MSIDVPQYVPLEGDVRSRVAEISGFRDFPGRIEAMSSFEGNMYYVRRFEVSRVTEVRNGAVFDILKAFMTGKGKVEN